MRELTSRQQQILRYLNRCIQDNGYPPTRAEIAQHFGFQSPNAAESHLRALQNKGVIRILRGQSRGIELADSVAKKASREINLNQESLSLPLIGRVAAGSPLLAVENHEGHSVCDAQQFSQQAHYLLRVEGESMINAGILDGDLLAVHQQETADNGQIVVARIDDEITVKRFFRPSARSVELRPENPRFSPLLIDLEQSEFQIEGLGVGVIRQSLSSG